MGRIRQQQHKVESEEKKKNKLLTETLRENQQLRRKLARAEKKAEKARLIEPLEPPEAEVVEPTEKTDLGIKPGCPECGAEPHEISSVVLPSGTRFSVCQKCGRRTNGRSPVDSPRPRK